VITGGLSPTHLRPQSSLKVEIAQDVFGYVSQKICQVPWLLLRKGGGVSCLEILAKNSTGNPTVKHKFGFSFCIPGASHRRISFPAVTAKPLLFGCPFKKSLFTCFALDHGPVPCGCVRGSESLAVAANIFVGQTGSSPCWSRPVSSRP